MRTALNSRKRPAREGHRSHWQVNSEPGVHLRSRVRPVPIGPPGSRGSRAGPFSAGRGACTRRHRRWRRREASAAFLLPPSALGPAGKARAGPTEKKEGTRRGIWPSMVMEGGCGCGTKGLRRVSDSTSLTGASSAQAHRGSCCPRLPRERHPRPPALTGPTGCALPFLLRGRTAGASSTATAWVTTCFRPGYSSSSTAAKNQAPNL